MKLPLVGTCPWSQEIFTLGMRGGKKVTKLYFGKKNVKTLSN